MTDFIDRLEGASVDHDPPREVIDNHQFWAGYLLYADGAWTAAEARGFFDLQGDELTQVLSFKAVLDAISTLAGKNAYLAKAEAIGLWIQTGGDTVYHNPDGSINKARVAADLGI